METNIRPIPYEGKEKYIFVSYSHKDSDIVLPIIDKMCSDGYRVWYDDGINPGTEWPEVIATHLNDCDICFAFLSNSYVDSFNCKREIDFAIKKRKQLLSVFLEETNLPLGVEMQISTTQSVDYYKIPKDLFFEKLYALDFMNKFCNREEVTQEKILNSVPENQDLSRESTDSDNTKNESQTSSVTKNESEADNKENSVVIYLDPKPYLSKNDVIIYVEGSEKWRGQLGDYAKLILEEKKIVEIKVESTIVGVGGKWVGTIDPDKGKKYLFKFVKRDMFHTSKFTLDNAEIF